MKRLFLIIGASLLGLILTGARAGAQTASDEAPSLLRLATNNSFNGSWQINSELSDSVSDKIQALLTTINSTALRAEKPDSALSALPTLSISLSPPETLVLATEDESETTLNECYENVVLTRTFSGDGITREFRAGGSNANFTVQAVSTENKLIITTVSPRGNRMTEIYQPANVGKQLTVTVRIESPQGAELITLHRVYDRMADEIPMMDEL